MVVDTLFYDLEWRQERSAGEGNDFAATQRAIPDGWERRDNGEWLFYKPDNVSLPAQGWKIHVAAILTNADAVLDKVWDYCVPRRHAFKFLRTPRVLLRRNAKEAGRGSSGKFVTIYPLDVAEMELACKELDELLRAEPGPYILSDLRWGDGPVHVRYGGFLDLHCRSTSGALVPAIRDDTGRLVPDSRAPAFSVPPWVDLPACLVPHLQARNAATVADVPYRIERALLFSNGGGVYAGTDVRTGAQVVLKEARPHAGLTADGADAVRRLRHEHATLQRLDGIPGVPGVHDLVSAGGHLFLVMDHIDGTPLSRRIVTRNPGLGEAVDPTAAADYTRWCLEVCAEVERIVDRIHERGVVHADLHPRNILVGPDDRVAALVDYEVAFDATAPGRQELAAPGYRAPTDRRGTEVDDYALACLRLGIFMPLTPLFELCPGKADEVAATIVERFPAPAEWLAEAVHTITGGGSSPRRAGDGDPAPTGSGCHSDADDGAAALRRPPVWRAAEPGGWRTTRDALVRAIAASATPQRDDRLFPGDRAQFRTGGLNLAHGAAGVLYALSVTGAGDDGSDGIGEYEQWLIDHATQTVPDPRLGFYDGYHGVAYVLEHLGHRIRALDVLDLCMQEPWEASGHGLSDGLAGIGLNLLHLARTIGESDLHRSALRAADILVDRLAGPDDPSDISGGDHPYAGLLHGWTGPALLFLHLYEATGDGALLEAAATALRRDLRRCVAREDHGGVLHVNEGNRTMPYLATGSVGIGLVLDHHLAHAADEELTAARAAIQGAACGWFYAEPGLFHGRAGMITYLAALPADGEQLLRQVDLLRWHALPFEGGIAFPGEHLLHLSMDLATGAAGVLLALGAALHDRPVHLPFVRIHPPRPDGPVSIP